ncbi:helix-turn-helix domain-containing protein [Denitromonas iodatirespirans]|uniref:Helix-turn-helix domain-containing protein n=1 Tax=Denitromonas iodatirespirans TaxID=2795389 RepID=A0A944HDR6_DENI1|nr:helix-turn-helix domain-containing protein [Denitromonas iodatirespirans]MBT0964012.1 helix-turn-helix domain-containing protein [Denitromonas iodatirespirans]
MPSHAIPRYQLYGEKTPWATPEPVHFETIAARSALHDWEIDLHNHDGLTQILHLASGEAHMTLETEHIELTPPCLVLMPAGRVHGFRFSPDIDGQIVSIPLGIQRELLGLSPELAAALDQAAHHPLAALPDARAQLARVFRQFGLEYRSHAPGRLMMMTALLTEVLVWLARAAHASRTPPDSRQQQRLARYRHLIDEHFRHWQPVGFYADRLGISTAQLNNTCRRETGHSAKALIHERLLLEARRLLAYTDLDITTIALNLGFEDPAYFSRFFTRHQAMPPSAYRARHQS